MIKKFEKLITGVEKLLDRIVALIMLVIMLVVVASVVMRYVLHSPLIWGYDLIGLYLMPAVFFFALSGTYAINKHISLDILVQKFNLTGRRLAEILTSLLAIPLFFLIAQVGAERAYADWLSGNAMAGLIAWPTWISYAIVPLGAGLLAIRLIFRLFGQIVSLVRGKNVVDVIPIIGHGKD